MSTTDRNATGEGPLAAALEVDPFTALAVHFGMLLGVSDFQVLAANPRGKLALHQAWQHGKGVVWGYPVGVGDGPAELTVGPGLAVDGLGREVASGVDLCLDVSAWLDDQERAGTVTVGGGADRRTVDARLVLRHEACLSRPVPTVGSGCGTDGSSTGYSRVVELAHLELRPRPVPAPDDRDGTFTALRDLVRDGVVPAGLTRPPGALGDFRAVAAQVVAGLAPPGVAPPRSPDRTTLFPEDEPGEIVLADLPGLTLTRVAGGWRLEAPVIDLSVRRSHVPTWMLGELIAELLAGGRGGDGGGGACASDAGGPRVETITRSGVRVTVEFSGEIVPATVVRALEVRPFDVESGWGEPIALAPDVTVTSIAFDLPAVPSGTVSYRMVLRGTGSTPLVGLVDGRPVPLAGRVGGPPGTTAGGHDVVRRFPQRGAQP